MDKKKGIVYLHELERGEIELELENPSIDHTWITKSLVDTAPPELELSPEDWAKNVKLSGSIKVERLGAEYMLSGDFKADVQGLCSRCAEPFPVHRASGMQLFFEASKKSKYNRALEDGGDPDYIVLENDKIELTQLLTEQLLIQVPYSECPNRSEDGTCGFCGKNPQFAGQDKQKSEESSPFSKLKKLSREYIKKW